MHASVFTAYPSRQVTAVSAVQYPAASPQFGSRSADCAQKATGVRDPSMLGWLGCWTATQIGGSPLSPQNAPNCQCDAQSPASRQRPVFMPQNSTTLPLQRPPELALHSSDFPHPCTWRAAAATHTMPKCLKGCSRLPSLVEKRCANLTTHQLMPRNRAISVPLWRDSAYSESRSADLPAQCTRWTRVPCDHGDVGIVIRFRSIGSRNAAALRRLSRRSRRTGPSRTALRSG